MKDTLIIANASDKPNRGQLLVYDAVGRPWQQYVPLGPRQSIKFSVSDLVSKAGLAGSYDGIKFAVAERSNSVDTVYFMYDETSGFSVDEDVRSRSHSHRAGACVCW